MSGEPSSGAASARATARFRAAPPGRGHYESFYLKAADPARPRAVWIRYTAHKRPDAAPTASLWFTLFDRAGSETRASKVTVAADGLSTGGGDYIRIGDGRLAPGRATGRAASDRLDASWELEFDAGDEPLRHLPREWMYRAPVPRTKLETPHPGVRFRGRLGAGDEEIEVDGWPGMVGHNWGSEHAERWIWLHGAGFENHPGTWIDVGLGRVRLGPLTTPWVANGCIMLDGVGHRLGGIERVRPTRVEETPHGCEFLLPGPEVTVRGTVEAPAGDLVGWVYADPDGPEHNVVNCSIAAMRLEVRRPGAPPLDLHTSFGATYELGMRETDHGVPLQPFPDG